MKKTHIFAMALQGILLFFCQIFLIIFCQTQILPP